MTPPGTTTRVILLRHGVTVHTTAHRFSGGLGGDNPPLAEEGRQQIAAAAEWLAERAGPLAALIASPVRRTRESADIVAARLGLEPTEEQAFAEMEFGAWDGLTFAEIHERDPDLLDGWLNDETVSAPGGESFRQVQQRVLTGLETLVAGHPGGTVLVVSHVTPIKTLVAHALGVPQRTAYRMELFPASISELTFYAEADGGTAGSLRTFNLTAH